ncbi:MAG: phosphoribosylformylglycinamidine synthase subunit PurQ, partial [Lachnospiraceae bacterium]|nr:phosphoribosylformylglycinamidine synthase subunit PurQ [Lachnospiraceae bacterium]
AVPKKYEGLDGTELAISESQERMAVVVAAEDADAFLALAAEENLQACIVAKVKADPRLTMTWNGRVIVNVSREFLNSNGAEKHIDIAPLKAVSFDKTVEGGFKENFLKMASDLNSASKRGLSERFDSTIGAGTVLMPFGGRNQLTPIQAMVQKISTEKKYTDDCSLMSWGYNPLIAEKSPYHSAYLSVVEAVSKLIATGASFEDVYLTMQEYFEKPGTEKHRWGKPLAALLGAFEAQIRYGIGSIGGKDSMSGSFEDLDVPPTLITFAVTTDKTQNIVTNELKKAGNRLYLLTAEKDEKGLPETEAQIALFNRVTELLRTKKAVSAYTPGIGGAAEAVMKMAFGNGFGFRFEASFPLETLFGYAYGAFILEAEEEIPGACLLGEVTEEKAFVFGDDAVSYEEAQAAYEGKLESVYPCNITEEKKTCESFIYKASEWAAPRVKTAEPRVLIPVFPGTNCEYDSAKAVERAGMVPEIFVINNLTSSGIQRSVEDFSKKLRNAQMVFIPGVLSGGDEPDGSGKFITAFFRNERIREGVT